MLQNNRTDDWISRDIRPPEFRPGPVVSLTEVLAVLGFLTAKYTDHFADMFRSAWPCCTLPHHRGADVYRQGATIVNAKAAPADAASVSTIVESQIGIIKSESIASAVIRDSHCSRP